jgi:hypothetical protein
MRSTDAFPKKFLTSAEVKAKPIIAVISGMEMETVGQGADQKNKPVLYVEGQKPIILNRTNFETLEEAFGDSDNWPGHKVKAYSAPTRYQGKATEGIRLAPIVPKPAPKSDPDELNDEVAV